MGIQSFAALAVSNTAVNLPSAIRTLKVDFAVITVEDDQVRFRIDGSDPTSSEGHLLEVGDQLELHDAQEIQAIRFIRVTGDADLKISVGRAKTFR